jgi:hypothetical protein
MRLTRLSKDKRVLPLFVKQRNGFGEWAERMAWNGLEGALDKCQPAQHGWKAKF